MQKDSNRKINNNIGKDLSMTFLYKMMLIRAFENTIREYKLRRQIYGMAHCYNGQEAIAVGACTALKKKDYVISNHRPHGHAIAKGVNISKIMAEIFGKSTGTSGGKGGSMHICDKNVRFLPSTGIVGSGIPIACGTAFASKYKKENNVTCVFFGDGAANEDVLHECLNLASIWKLPIIFILEDNGLAVTTQTKCTSACLDYTTFSLAYNLKGVKVNGQDVEEVYMAVLEAADLARNSNCPTLIQAKTIRFCEHAEGEYYLKMRDSNYRDNNVLLKQIEKDCPIKKYIKILQDRKIITTSEILELEQMVNNEVNNSIEFAFQSSSPDIGSAFQNIY